MKAGLTLHAERGVDAVFDEARLADEQGFDSIWLNDHLMEYPRGREQLPNRPLDSFTLMTALGATTKRVRLAWAMLNLGFRHPAVLAKMLASLDVITQGRVIATLGAGWFEPEYIAYQLPSYIADHDGRIAYAREALTLMREFWTHPAPDHVNFEGKYFRAVDAAFNPAPSQQPSIPIWFGGDSEASLGIVKDLADGWVMLTSGNPETLARVLGAPDWPERPMAVVKSQRIFVSEDRDQAIAEAEASFRKNPGRQSGVAASFEDFLAREVVGTPDECLKKLEQTGSWGVNYIRCNFDTLEQQERAARLILPHL